MGRRFDPRSRRNVTAWMGAYSTFKGMLNAPEALPPDWQKPTSRWHVVESAMSAGK
jgi:hypothetical protein